jgi:hypothetical protein
MTLNKDYTQLLKALCLKAHKAEIEQAAFSPDGRWIVTASDDK